MLSAVLCNAVCAKIGDPQPPEILIPEPASDLAARQLSDFVSLTVSQPQRNTNGSEATTLRRVEILRFDTEDSKAGGSLPQDQFIKGAVRIFSIPASRFPEFLTNRVFAFRDGSLAENPSAYSRTFWYAALFINPKNQSA